MNFLNIWKVFKIPHVTFRYLVDAVILLTGFLLTCLCLCIAVLTFCDLSHQGQVLIPWVLTSCFLTKVQR